MAAKVTGLVPMVHVVSVEGSISFYEQLGLEVVNRLKNQGGTTVWTFMKSRGAEIMFTLGEEPVAAGQQGILFYLYADNLVGLREQLTAKGVSVSAITFPPYMQKGEMQLQDPDGYCLMIGQSDRGFGIEESKNQLRGTRHGGLWRQENWLRGDRNGWAHRVSNPCQVQVVRELRTRRIGHHARLIGRVVPDSQLLPAGRANHTARPYIIS